MIMLKEVLLLSKNTFEFLQETNQRISDIDESCGEAPERLFLLQKTKQIKLIIDTFIH